MISWIIFDCMETLIDIHGYSKPEDYAYSAFHGSKIENYWPDFSQFCYDFLKYSDALNRKLAKNKEYEYIDLFDLMCKQKIQANIINSRTVAGNLQCNFLKNYIVNCSFDYKRIDLLEKLRKKYKLGIASNFKVKGGIEKILSTFNIRHYFEFVITSASIGWKKPSCQIYKAVLANSLSTPEKHVFVGDDFQNDYKYPMNIGMNAILLDKRNQYSNIRSRVKSLFELAYYLN